jgi:hypothetical protein
VAVHILDRKTLQEIRRLASLKAVGGFTPYSVAAWNSLAHAADHCDALLARNEQEAEQRQQPSERE